MSVSCMWCSPEKYMLHVSLSNRRLRQISLRCQRLRGKVLPQSNVNDSIMAAAAAACGQAKRPFVCWNPASTGFANHALSYGGTMREWATDNSQRSLAPNIRSKRRTNPN